MITSGSAERWPTDQVIVDLRSAGLERACVVRWKLATLASAFVTRKIGAISVPDRNALTHSLSRVLPT